MVDKNVPRLPKKMALFFRSVLTSHRSAKITKVGGILVTVTVCWVFLLFFL